ncbi:MAG: hypothetical protein ACRC37_03490, partial [Lentisphaeria bacterium]
LKTVLSELHSAVAISRCMTNFNLISEVHILVPRYAEHEVGFGAMIKSHIAMCQRLKTKMIFYTYASTQKVIEGIFTSINSSLSKKFITVMRDKDYRGNLPESFSDTSILLFVMSRSNSISYSSKYEKMVHHLQQENSQISQIDYYPEVLSPELRIAEPSFKL